MLPWKSHYMFHVTFPDQEAMQVNQERKASCSVPIEFIYFITSTAINPFTPEFNPQAMPYSYKF